MIQSDVKGGSQHGITGALEYKRWLAVPYPTGVDRAQNEPKVQANLVIAEAADGARALLLRCTPGDMDRVLVLRSREDYLPVQPDGREQRRLTEKYTLLIRTALVPTPLLVPTAYNTVLRRRLLAKSE